MELFKTVPHIHGFLFIFANTELRLDLLKKVKCPLKNCQDDI